MREVPQYSQTGGQGQSVVELGVARADAEDAGVARQPVQGKVILIVTRTHHLTHQILLLYSFISTKLGIFIVNDSIIAIHASIFIQCVP